MDIVTQPNWQRIEDLYRFINTFAKDMACDSSNAVTHAKRELITLLGLDDKSTS